MLRLEPYRFDRNEHKQLKKLYHTSFPREERLPFWYITHKTKKRNNNLFLIYDAAHFIGLLHEIEYNSIVFIGYLAVKSEYQGKGYGSRILHHVHQRHKGKRIVLNIEPVDIKSTNTEQRKRRKSFYLANGYTVCDFRIREGGNVFEMLCFGGMMTFPEYHDVVASYFGPFLTRILLKEVKI